MRVGVTRRLLHLMKGQRWLMAVSASCRIVNQGLGVLIPALAAGFVVGVVEGSVPGLGTIVLVLVGLALVKGLFRYLEQFTGHAVAFRLLALLRNRVFRWLERVEPAALEGRRSGDLVARVSGDISRVEPFYAHTIAPAAAAVVVPAISVVGLLAVAGRPPALTLSGFVVLYLVVVPWLGRRSAERIGPQVRRMAGEAAAEVSDIVQGAQEIAVLGAGQRVLDEADRSDLERVAAEQQLARGSGRRALAGGLISAGAVVAVAAVAVAADLDALGLVVSIVVAWTVMTPLRALEEIAPDTEQALAAAARLFDLEDMEPQVRGQTSFDARSSRGVGFRDLSVQVGDSVLVDRVDLEVESGRFVGVVGPSGSGKSTLVQTLVRHRDPSSGRVEVGGRDVAELTPADLANAVALVPQRPDVFHGSLRSNLLVARPDATSPELLAALDRARLRGWVEALEAGLDTRVGERGLGLSGGQLQRLAMARAFLRDPAVLVLDEATSELDPETETEVLGEVLAERGKRTLIVVAHRMETVTTADLIAVMDRGRLVELGKHEELKARAGLYAALWERHEDMLADV